MCRALRILCAAPDQERLAALKRAASGAQWEVVGGSTSASGLAEDLRTWRPDVVVIEGLGSAPFAEVRAVRPGARLISVGVGAAEGADAVADSLEDVRSAILGVPGPRGPVGR